MRVLVFAPHNDDEVLGVGGTIARYARNGDEVFVCEVTKGDTYLEVNRREALAAHRVLGVKETIFLDFPPVELIHQPREKLNGELQKVVMEVKPNIVYIPHYGDMHTDHRTLTDSVMVALRPHVNPQLSAIYIYETLSETEWNIPSANFAFVPNVWHDISETLSIKTEAMECYKIQLHPFPHPRSIQAIEYLAKYRGSSVGYDAAEAFMLVRQNCVLSY